MLSFYRILSKNYLTVYVKERVMLILINKSNPFCKYWK